MGINREKIRIDRRHTLQLIDGKPIVIKVPPGAKELQLELDSVSAREDSFANLVDVFFNGRKAR